MQAQTSENAAAAKILYREEREEKPSPLAYRRLSADWISLREALFRSQIARAEVVPYESVSGSKAGINVGTEDIEDLAREGTDECVRRFTNFILHSSNMGTWRWSVGRRWRRVAPITAITVRDSRAVRGTKIRCVFDRWSGGLIK